MKGYCPKGEEAAPSSQVLCVLDVLAQQNPDVKVLRFYASSLELDL